MMPREHNCGELIILYLFIVIIIIFYVLRTKASVWYISDCGISNRHMSGAFTVRVWGIIM